MTLRLPTIKSFLILLVFGFVCQDFGPISYRLEGLLILTALVVYIFVCNPLRRSNLSGGDTNLLPTANCQLPIANCRLRSIPDLIVKAVLPYLFFIIFAVFISQIANNLLQLFALTAFLLCLLFFSRLSGESADVHVISILATIFFTFAIFLYQYFSEYWYVVQSYALFFSHICSFIFARVLNLGPSSFGFFIFVSFVIYHCIIFGLGRNRSIIRFSLAILYLFAATIMVVGINLLGMHFLKEITFAVERNVLHSQLLVFLISCPSVLFYKNLEIQKISIIPSKNIYRYAIPCLGVFVICIGIFIIPFFQSEPMEGKTVAFYKKGSLDWDIPRFGTYGQRSGGMFGLMPRYLSVMGTNTKMIDNITVSDLSKSDVLVMINLDQALSKEEILVIWDFVRNGGGLLILGDHTNLAGLMVNFNKILDIVNIKFKFDSAMPTRYTWDFLMEERPHPLTTHFSMETSGSWWVGASVECKPPAEPVVLGKYCYSDWGYKDNEKNAYLGNRRFDYYEPLDDQVLAAYSRYGKGKVMVCGDTSSFHNTTLMITYPFVLNVFKFLADSHQGWGVIFPRILLILISLLIIFSAVITFRKVSNLILPLSLLFVICLAGLISNYGGSYRRDTDVPFNKLNIAYIDYFHKERFDLMSWEDDSIGGFRNNLLRNGFLPQLLEEFDADKLLKSGLLVIIAPTQPFTNKETEILSDFVKNGGRIIISVGWEEMEASLPVLEHFGLGIDSVPLGWCQSDYKDTKIQFHEAWPVIFKNTKDVEVICEPLGYPAVVSKRYGSGSVTLIADSCFLLNENLEGSKTYSVPNIFLLRDLLIK